MGKRRIIKYMFRCKGRETITRALLDTRVESLNLKGLSGLDLGSGNKGSPGYYGYIADLDKHSLLTVNIAPELQPDVLADLEAGLPFENDSVDYVLMFNLLEHMYNFQYLCSEVSRVLKKGGNCYIFVPFLYGIHEDPNDYFRYTAQALNRVLKEVGFSSVAVESLGFGAITTSWFFIPKVSYLTWLLLLMFPLCLWLDGVMDRRAKKHSGYPYNSFRHPMAYFVTALK